MAIVAVGLQPVEFVHRETEYFKIEMPPEWKLKPLPPERRESTTREFLVIDDASKEVFQVSVAIDGPRFIQCFCAPWSRYKRYQKNGLKYAELTSKDRRTLKVMGKRYGTDVHLLFGDFDRTLLNQIVESIRPI